MPTMAAPPRDCAPSCCVYYTAILLAQYPVSTRQRKQRLRWSYGI